MCLLPASLVWSQEARVIWQKNIGGIGYDWVDALVSDENGFTYVLSTVQEGDNHQVQVAKLNEDGETQWSKVIGGSRDETGKEVIITSNGNIVITGASYSKNLSSNLINKGYSDIFIATFTPEGELIQMNLYGGSQIDMPASIMERANGNILVSATSWSDDHDVNENAGNADIWLFEVNAKGTILWSQSFGGSNDDYAVKTIELEDQSLLLLGNTETNNNEYSAHHGDLDIILYKLNGTGSLEWLQLYGGFLRDFGSGVSELDNGNFLVAGSTFSNEGNIYENAGGSDAWLFEVDTQGFLQWSKTYGSYGNESIASLQKKDDGFVIFGSSTSSVMNNVNSHGSQDFWLYEISSDMEIVDEYLFGSSGFDEGYSVVLNPDGSVLMGGLSNSKEGVSSNESGNNDGLILKVQPNISGKTTLATAHPNPTKDLVYINRIPENSTIQVTNKNGQMVLDGIEIFGAAKAIDLSAYPSGVYFVNILSPDHNQVLRVIKD